jgi:hypothetical protein
LKKKRREEEERREKKRRRQADCVCRLCPYRRLRLDRGAKREEEDQRRRPKKKTEEEGQGGSKNKGAAGPPSLFAIRPDPGPRPALPTGSLKIRRCSY